MKLHYFILKAFVFSFVCLSGFAQTPKDSLEREENPDLQILGSADKKKKKEEKDEPKQPKNVYWGIKAKKGFTKRFGGDKQELELFHYLPEYSEPNYYVQDIFWYDTRKKEVTTTRNIDKNTFRLMHGPYQKFIAGKVVEEGYFYKGTRHGRWEKYNGNYILLDKVKYHHGWLKESEITYYDVNRTKIKEVIPVQYGIKKGDYFQFYEGGQLAVRGRFDNDHKVGKWVEYYPTRRRVKKEIQYPTDAFDKETEPFVLKEYDEKGKLIYDSDKDGKKTLSQF